AGEFLGELAELGVQREVLALEEDRGLPQDLGVADLLHTTHGGTTSSARRRGKIFVRRADDERRRRQRHASDDRATFQEQLQLAHGQGCGFRKFWQSVSGNSGWRRG